VNHTTARRLQPHLPVRLICCSNVRPVGPA